MTVSAPPEVTPYHDLDEVFLEAMREGVIDPDLGVNVADLGFVRGYFETEECGHLVMTLTSPSCPVTGLLEDMVRTALEPVVGRPVCVEWVWSPAWQPADITDSGREQLGAIGFSFR